RAPLSGFGKPSPRFSKRYPKANAKLTLQTRATLNLIGICSSSPVFGYERVVHSFKTSRCGDTRVISATSPLKTRRRYFASFWSGRTCSSLRYGELPQLATLPASRAGGPREGEMRHVLSCFQIS